MQAEYKKEWLDTYLWVLAEQAGEHEFEEQMLLHNPGEGRLEFLKQEQEGEEYFCYKVTGKKALSSIYAVMAIGERQIRKILHQIFSILESGREYLLTEEDFVLSPNYIFAAFPQMTLELCYVPGYGVPLQEQLEGLFEYLLNRVDYEDKQAVSLLYDCYMFCVQEKGGLPEIKKRLEKEDQKEKEEDTETGGLADDRLMEKEGGYPGIIEEDDWNYEAGPEKKPEASSYVSWLTDRLFHRKKRETALVAEETPEYCAIPGKQEGVFEKTGPEESGKQQESRIPVEEPDMERTVLLSVRENRTVPELVYERTGEVIPLTKFPFYIGSAAEYTDFVPVGDDISRMHCCISKKLDNYYLADLNSTNGTYHNQKEVLPGKLELLAANDEVKVASQIFYIKFPCH
ncbi:MAG: FHA domain-containing protein [Lachnospiraceae bacterium]|nr:FHA domain-containing protein [Lachnospiraceae bacterium]